MIVIASCTDRKHNSAMHARDLYMPSGYFKAQRRYAEAYGDKWFILSAEYGLLRPKQVVESYDQHMSDQDDPRYYERLAYQAQYLAEHHDNAEVIAGSDYADVIVTLLRYYGMTVETPFAGQRIGTRAKHLQQEAQKVENMALQDYVEG